jgi:hypothetical protein
LDENNGKRALVFHHDEADGLTSAALAKLALGRAGLAAELVCLDKLYPEVAADVGTRPGLVVVYADLGSGHVDLLSSLNIARNLVIVLDHHDTRDLSDPFVLNLNPELDGFSGEKEASSSTVAYMFAKTVDPALARYAHLGLIGSEEIPGEVQGLNAMVTEDAVGGGLAEKTPKGDFKIVAGESSIARRRASTVLNVLGSVGYYRGGPKMGINACINGFDGESLKLAGSLEEERKEANRKMLASIRERGLSQLKRVQWFHAHDNYAGMSGKVVGSFCSYLRYQSGVNPVKYLFGMMNVPPEIPGWGKLPAPLVKVSARAPQTLLGMIEKGTRPPLSRILSEACAKVEGFGDGHSVAASGVFPVGRENDFLKEIDRLASG